jgi:DNA-binding transcriptional ArsR family regulator
MATRKKILPTIEAVCDAEGVAFTCDGEPIEDMEFSWEDLTDPELLTEIAEELVEYIDSDELVEIDNPIRTVSRALRQLRKTKVTRKVDEESEAEEDELDEFDEDEME